MRKSLSFKLAVFTTCCVVAYQQFLEVNNGTKENSRVISAADERRRLTAEYQLIILLSLH